MNKIVFYIVLFATLFSFAHQANALPLNLGKTAKKLLAKLGIATYYDVEAGLGSCGKQSKNSQKVVAVNHAQMDNGENPNDNPKCGKKVKIVGPDGKTHSATVVDTCPGCDEGCLDMSSSLFQDVCGSLNLGICKISWDFQ